MLFNSYIFIFLFLPLTLVGYFFLNAKEKYDMAQLFLLIMSVWFCGFVNIAYLLILLPSIALNYSLVFFMNRLSVSQQKRKILVTLGVIINLLLLFVFKYYNFFIENVNEIFSQDFLLLNLFLPLGISFYTFQQITFLVDYYRDSSLRCTPVEYGVYITFFPQFIQGPIVLWSELIPQLRDHSKKKISYEDLAKGLYEFVLGLAKKVLIADSLAKIVTDGYGNISNLNTASAVILILSYTLQIYFDFSGYCDMAMGISKMFRIELPINFNSPYKATGIDDFWDRWHITLTRFFTRYVYIPLGGSRKGKMRTYCNIFIIFLLSGLWHGAAWTFIIWGVMHGIAMMVKRLLKGTGIKVPKMLEWLLTFIFVSLAWVFFRAESLSDAVGVLSGLFSGNFEAGVIPALYQSFNQMLEVNLLQRIDFLQINQKMPGIYAVLFVITILILSLFGENIYDRTKKFIPRISNCILIFILFVYCVISLSGFSSFLYFQF